MTTTEGTTASDIVRQAAAATGEVLPASMRPCQIDITREDEAVVAIAEAINHQLPDVYVRGGHVVEVAEVDNGTGPKLIIPSIEADRLRWLLAHHAHCFRMKITKDGEEVITSGLPSVSTARAALSGHHWPGIRPLMGVVSMPIVRPDGSMVTTRGYDPATQLYYRPAVRVPDVPERPSSAQVAAARETIFGRVLADFPWDSEASRANYVALLFTPLLRLYVKGLAPFGIISAATRGSGKTLLTDIISAAYGTHMTTWSRKEDEFRKRITSILKDSTEPVVVFDNVETTDTISHGALSMLLTSREWTDRILGVNDSFTGMNDRLWLATGNNVAVGGDIGSRSVLTRLDPGVERPETRDGFQIEDMFTWLLDDANRADLLWSLLVLARAWIAAGAPLGARRMRNFTNWAQALGGLVAFHGLDGFLGNAEELNIGADDGETTTASFVVKWFEKFGDRWTTAKALVASAQIDTWGGQTHDPWDGEFLTKESGGRTVPLTSKGLGRFLTARRDRIYSGYALRRSETQVENTWQWRVEAVDRRD